VDAQDVLGVAAMGAAEVAAQLLGSGLKTRKPPRSRRFSDGETRTRTGDTTIFSRVLYQLSYLAVAERA
jgi:hypothetical protein